jgi:hypothetical protein
MYVPGELECFKSHPCISLAVDPCCHNSSWSIMNRPEHSHVKCSGSALSGLNLLELACSTVDSLQREVDWMQAPCGFTHNHVAYSGSTVILHSGISVWLFWMEFSCNITLAGQLQWTNYPSPMPYGLISMEDTSTQEESNTSCMYVWFGECLWLHTYAAAFHWQVGQWCIDQSGTHLPNATWMGQHCLDSISWNWHASQLTHSG